MVFDNHKKCQQTEFGDKKLDNGGKAKNNQNPTSKKQLFFLKVYAPFVDLSASIQF